MARDLFKIDCITVRDGGGMRPDISKGLWKKIRESRGEDRKDRLVVSTG